MKLLITIISLFIFSQSAFSENAIVKVYDKETKQALAYANVCFKNIMTKKEHCVITTEKGETINSIRQQSEIIISFLGYKTLIDTINPGESKTYALQQDIFNMEQIVVTGTRTQKTLSNSPILTKLISQQEIEKNGSASVFEAMENAMPGVSFTPDPHGQNMTIQGMDNSNILILLDGKRLTSEKRSNVNLDRINVDNIKQIEIVNGALSSLYGSNAMGGVINIITKEAQKPLEVSVNNRYGTNNTCNINTNIGISRDKWNLLISGLRNSSDGFDLSPEIPESREMKKYVDYGTNLKVNFNISDNLKLQASTNYYTHEPENPIQDITPIHKTSKNYGAGGNLQYTSLSKKHFVVFSANTDVSRTEKVFERMNSIVKDGENKFSSLRFSENYNHNEKMQLTVGSEFNFESVFSSDKLGPIPTEKNSRNIDFFAQADYKPIKKINIIPGLRYTHHSSFGNHLTYQMSTLLNFKKIKIRGNVGTAYKTPSLKEMYYDFEHQGMFHIIGNPNLKPEKGLYTSLSGEYHNNTINLSLNIYSNSIKDKILMYDISKNGHTEKHHANISEASLSGIETFATIRFLKNFKLHLGYNYSDAKDDKTKTQLYGNCYHSGISNISWNGGSIFNHTLSLRLSGRLTSGKYWYKREPLSNNVINITSKPYSIYKFSANKVFVIKDNYKLSINFKVNNLFAFKDDSFLDPGRFFMLGLKFNYKYKGV